MLVGLGYWNDWVNGLYYINNDKLYSVQVLLTNIQRHMDSLKQTMGVGSNVSYPFIQKYLVKGIAIGAVKG